MRCQKRNLVKIYYCLYDGKEPVLDSEGYETSEYKIIYQAPVLLYANVSPNMGNAQTEMFGNISSYDRVIVVDDPKCPIDENSVLFIDCEPAYDDEGKPLYNYIVKKAAPSLNSTSYAVSKVGIR